jgi:hypothetical protein
MDWKITLKLIIQGLLQLYYKDMSFDLIQMKVLLMASICKVAFNIDGWTRHSTLNIPIQ